MYCIHCGKEIKDNNIPCYYCGKEQKTNKTEEKNKKVDIKVIRGRDDEEYFKNIIKELVEEGYEIKASNCTTIQTKFAVHYVYYALLQKIEII